MSHPTAPPRVYLDAALDSHEQSWLTGEPISRTEMHRTIGLILTYLRALDSASSQSPSHQDGAAPSRVSELQEILNLLGRSLQEADSWLLVYEARDRLRFYLDATVEAQ